MGIGGLALVAGALLWRAVKAGNSLEFFALGRIHKISLKGITLGIDVNVKNPSPGRLRIKHPFVKITFQGVTLGLSQSANRDHIIAPYSDTWIRGLMIDVPIQQLAMVAPSVIGLLSGKVKELPVSIEVSTTAFAPGIPPVPYTYAESVQLTSPLKNGSNA